MSNETNPTTEEQEQRRHENRLWLGMPFRGRAPQHSWHEESQDCPSKKVGHPSSWHDGLIKGETVFQRCGQQL